jgi:hypothetical protein
MTFEEIVKRIGKNIKYYDDTNGWVTGRDVTETDIGDFVNEIYKEELFPLFSSRYPHLFRHTGLLPSHLFTTTALATSTGSTLEITASDSASFSNQMVGLTVYNSTDGDTRVIDSYTDTSTVVLTTAIDDDWDGDTIYVCGAVFALGGDATDFVELERVRVRYDTDDEYIVAEIRDLQDIMVENQTTDILSGGSQAYPEVYLTSVLDSAILYPAIGVRPGFDDYVLNALEFDYIAKPATLAGSQTPIIPIHASLIAGGTMRAYDKKQDVPTSKYWAERYYVSQKRDISRYRPQTSNVPTKIRVSRNAYYQQRRVI